MGNTYICHTGVIGMKWGIRRYQNPDGTLTEAGKKRYAKTGEYGYNYKSKLTKRHENKAVSLREKAAQAEASGNAGKAARLNAKADTREKKAEYNREIDRRMQDYAKSVKTGGNLAVRYLTNGTIGGKPYQTMLAAVNGQDRSRVSKKVVAWLGGAAATGFGGVFGDLAIRGIGYQMQKGK